MGSGFLRRQDGDFSEQRFRDTVNAALANSVGNLANRALNLVFKNCGGALPAAAADVPAAHPLRATAAAQARARPPEARPTACPRQGLRCGALDEVLGAAAAGWGRAQGAGAQRSGPAPAQD